TQVKALADAVIRAFQNEVVDREQQYQNATRDALAKSLSKMSSEIMNKMEARNAIAKEVGVADSGSGKVLQQLDIKRLERIEEELMRLEHDSLHDEVRAVATSGRTPEQTVDAEFLKRR